MCPKVRSVTLEEQASVQGRVVDSRAMADRRPGSDGPRRFDWVEAGIPAAVCLYLRNDGVAVKIENVEARQKGYAKVCKDANG